MWVFLVPCEDDRCSPPRLPAADDAQGRKPRECAGPGSVTFPGIPGAGGTSVHAGPVCRPRVGTFPGRRRARGPCASRRARDLWRRRLSCPRRQRGLETGGMAASSTSTKGAAAGAGSTARWEACCRRQGAGKRAAVARDRRGSSGTGQMTGNSGGARVVSNSAPPARTTTFSSCTIVSPSP